MRHVAYIGEINKHRDSIGLLAPPHLFVSFKKNVVLICTYKGAFINLSLQQ